MDRKRVSYKVFDPANSYKFMGLWDEDVINELQISQDINTYSSSITVELARNSDTTISYTDVLTTEDNQVLQTESGLDLGIDINADNNIGLGTNVSENLSVEIWVYYGFNEILSTEANNEITTEDGIELLASLGATNGLLKFKGRIDSYSSRYGSTETTLVKLVSDSSDLKDYVIKNGASTTYAMNSIDPSQMLKNVIDSYVAQGGRASYSADTISTTASVASYTFNTNPAKDGIETVTKLSPSGWYGYTDLGTNKVYFRPRGVTPVHTFVLGKHILSLDLEKTMSEMVNEVLFTGGDVSGTPLFVVVSDAASIATYGKKLKIMSDSRVTVEASARLLAQSEIDRGKLPRYKTSLAISSADYDIETIKPGDIVGFTDFGNYIDNLQLQVVGIDYTPEVVNLHLDTLLPTINKRVQDIQRNLEQQMTARNPSVPS